MRKIIEANTTDNSDLKAEKDAKRDRNTKVLTGLAAYSILHNSSKNRDRQKLMNDIMYYLRKLINLAKKVQNLSEGVDEDDIKLTDEFTKLKSEIDELEGFVKEKP